MRSRLSRSATSLGNLFMLSSQGLDLSLLTGKPAFGICDQVGLKLTCSVIEAS